MQELEQVIGALPVAAYVCEAPDGRIRFWNRLAADIWGREPAVGDAGERFCGSLGLFSADGSPLPHANGPVAEVLRTGHPRTDDVVIGRPDLVRVQVRVRASPVRDREDRVAGVVAVLQEVTDHERAREALWHSEARYRTIVEDQPDLVCRFLADGTLTFANEAYCAFFGINREDAAGKDYMPVVHPDDFEAVRTQIARLSPTNPVVFIENRVLRADGAVRWTEWINRALFDEQGRIVEFQSAGRDVTERKQAEQDAARLAAIVANADSAIFGMTLDGAITSWNRSAERMFGYSADEAIGRPISIVIPADRLHEGTELLTRLGRGETVRHFETERIARDGRRLPVSLTVSPIRDTNGRLIGISKIARDISERKRTERELQEREGRFRLMADHAPVLIWLADTDNNATYFNRPWLDFTGVPLDAQVGDGWLSLVHADDVAEAAAVRQEHVTRRAPFVQEFRLRHQSGEFRWVQNTGQPLFLPDGTFNGYIGSSVDIDARKAAEVRIRRILEGISDAFSAVDREWRFTYVNEHYTQLTGQTAAALLGRVCWDLLPETQRASLFPAAHQAVRDQQPAQVEEYCAPLDLWLETRLYPSPDGLIAFTTDITDRKRVDAARERAVERESDARAAAEEASRLKDEFLAIVSHELRTPLNAMLGWAQMLREGSVAPDAVPKALDTIERNARMQAQLVEDLLDVSRIISGKLPLRIERVELGSVVQAALEAVRPAAANKNIRLSVNLGSGATTVSGDASRLQQAVWNLLTNAVKFTPRRGQIDVNVSRTDTDATLTVRDTGSGIPPEALPFIFDRFRQADSRTTRAHGGLGLGLTIVEYLAEAHGGTVRAESRGPGHGATFTLTIPLLSGESVTGADGTAPHELPNLAGRRVLYVDDDPDAREIVTAIVERCGARVTTAASVAAAMEALRRARPDVLVGDIGMPGQDGYDLIRAVRALPGLGRIPAIALTAYAGPEYRDAALAAGYDLHLCKPVDADAFCAALLELSLAESS